MSQMSHRYLSPRRFTLFVILAKNMNKEKQNKSKQDRAQESTVKGLNK